MKNRSKWLGRISADDSVRDAAHVTLQSRLMTVIHFLSLASDHADKTPEHVHQLRVYTRRSLAALKTYRDVLSKKEAKWFEKRLRRIRRAAGDARDLDVFLQRYGEGDESRFHGVFLTELKKRRRGAQRPIVELKRSLIETGRFARRVERLLKSLKKKRKKAADHGSLDRWARSRLDSTARKFFQATPDDPTDLKALHRFRVRGKDLRYTIELLSMVFPAELRTSVYPLVSELQERLGELNDHATACSRLETWSEEFRTDRETTDHIHGLIAHERTQLELSIDRFGDWWTPEFVKELQSELHTLTRERRDEHDRAVKIRIAK